MFLFFFFFSSRRRHTRCLSDWSSDVCSSDLPESLYILLTAEKSRNALAEAETVIVDEIHAVATDKRGAHLALSLERFDALARRPLQRIGLSATQRPIEEVARLLVGAGRLEAGGTPRCAIVDA